MKAALWMATAYMVVVLLGLMFPATGPQEVGVGFIFPATSLQEVGVVPHIPCYWASFYMRITLPILFYLLLPCTVF